MRIENLLKLEEFNPVNPDYPIFLDFDGWSTIDSIDYVTYREYQFVPDERIARLIRLIHAPYRSRYSNLYPSDNYQPILVDPVRVWQD